MYLRGNEVLLYEWQDVESIIFETVSIALNEKNNTNVTYKIQINFGVNSNILQHANNKNV